jgi:hypothetical protein
LEREFKFFNQLEGGMCTMCAPGDQEKSCYSQCEQDWTEAAFTVAASGFDLAASALGSA